MAKVWPADAIRLDAYDAKAGAGGFYARCGWTKRGHATYRGAPLVYYELLPARKGSGKSLSDREPGGSSIRPARTLFRQP